METTEIFRPLKLHRKIHEHDVEIRQNLVFDVST